MRAYDLATLCWVLVFGARYLVQSSLYEADSTGWLAVARIAMGWPLAAVAMLATFLAIRRAANEDRHRHQAHVAVRMFAHVVKQLSQRFRTRSMLRPTKQARPPRQRDHRAATPDWQVFRRRVRCWQARFGGCLIEDQGVGQTLSFEDVNGRQVARRNQIGGIGWLLPNLQPTAKQRAEHTNMQGRRAPWRGGDRSAGRQTRGRVAGLGQQRIHLCAGDGG